MSTLTDNALLAMAFALLGATILGFGVEFDRPALMWPGAVTLVIGGLLTLRAAVMWQDGDSRK